MSLDRGTPTLVLENSSKAASWHKSLQQNVTDHHQWGSAAEKETKILMPQPKRPNFILPRRGRFATLHKETPLRVGDGSPSSEKSSLDDLYGSLSFVNSYFTPAHLMARPKALTLSSRASFRRWGSVKYKMPFKSKS